MIHCTTHAITADNSSFCLPCGGLMEVVILYTDSQDVQVTCSSAAISIYSTVHTTLSDDDDDDDDSSPVAGCLARADRAVWAQSTS